VRNGPFLALKPMVEAMGPVLTAQLKRAKRDPILSEGMAMMTTPFGRGGDQECACIKLDLGRGPLSRAPTDAVICAYRTGRSATAICRRNSSILA
jgi:hypothetical protein